VGQPERTSLLALRAQLSSDPRNIEDLNVTPTLRDDLLDLINRVSSTSLQAPTQSQLAMAARLHATYSTLVQAYHKLMTGSTS
ncbi:MAG TPA: hypothetical protein VEJ41_06935, partial [Candidatus Acidoferrales bacterium]|nr:hypothetical protein [Candidatus Acidoferrales bacterium]